MTTIYDVAEHAGVSIATVSKVMSGRPYVSSQTRERVQASVRALNYVPQVAARSLAGQQTHLIGVTVSYDPHDLFSDPYLLQILHGVDAIITEHDCALLLSTSRSADDPLSAYRRLIAGHRVDGVLIESGLGEEGVELLVKHGYPCVVIGYSELGLPCVHPDDLGGALQITRHLLELGHRRIGVVAGPASRPPAVRARLQGYTMALAEHGLSVDDQLLTFGTFRSASGYAGTAALMARNPPPTAIFAFNDRMAFGAVQWLREHSYRVPKDISVVGFDDIAGAEQLDPPLTTIHQSSVEIGQRAAELLFTLIKHGRVDETEVVLPAEIIVRSSTAAVRTAGKEEPDPSPTVEVASNVFPTLFGPDLLALTGDSL